MRRPRSSARHALTPIPRRQGPARRRPPHPEDHRVPRLDRTQRPPPATRDTLVLIHEPSSPLHQVDGIAVTYQLATGDVTTIGHGSQFANASIVELNGAAPLPFPSRREGIR